MQFQRPRKLCALVVICGLMLQACSTPGVLVTARDQFKYGSTEAAMQTLALAEVSSRDQLLLLMDTALVAQAAERYQESIIAFEEAFKLVDELDFISVRDQSTALFVNDWAIRYSGELSERLWIHTFQMINYLMLDQPDGAAVEARRAVALFDEHGDVLDEDVLTRYLMALSFEAAGQFDSANVEYRKLNEQFGINLPTRRSKNTRELVVLVASGFIEPKLAGDLIVDINARISFPFYPETFQREPDIALFGNAQLLDTQLVHTRLLPIARSALAKRGKAVAARHILRLVAKNQIADQLQDQDELVGAIAKVLFLVLEQADTRSWETLPAWLSLVRAEVPAGIDSVDVQINSVDEFSVTDHSRTVVLKSKPGSLTVDMIRLGVSGPDQSIPSP